MNQLERLSKISNAVLSPEGRHIYIRGHARTGLCGRSKLHESGKLTEDERKYRIDWCNRQKALIGEFGAILNAF